MALHWEKELDEVAQAELEAIWNLLWRIKQPEQVRLQTWMENAPRSDVNFDNHYNYNYQDYNKKNNHYHETEHYS